jgi:hypothetical protein
MCHCFAHILTLLEFSNYLLPIFILLCLRNIDTEKKVNLKYIISAFEDKYKNLLQHVWPDCRSRYRNMNRYQCKWILNELRKGEEIDCIRGFRIRQWIMIMHIIIVITIIIIIYSSPSWMALRPLWALAPFSVSWSINNRQDSLD